MRTPRTGRRPWTDLRFFIGLLLIVLSVAGVWLVVGAARQTSPVLQAARTIVPGEPLTSADVRVVEVMLGTAGTGYLTPARLQPGLIATRTIAEGELVPSSAAADADQGRTTSVVVRSTVPVPASVETGTVVEVWAADPRDDGKGFAEPRVLLSDAVVASVGRDDGPLSANATTLELVVSRSAVGEVLTALTGGASLSVVPVGARS
ncbi:SAF domain-containing protein [Microbacterium sp.]|uniref:SAF domain-containing protein n=1 Tax=Microbacterium sp. TaxID=51671 RepID=UPI001AD0F195|nr:SAF domain-containing protein [Microbacterium sp.]MBN9156270.1 hypothetical protein [Microbacterium sp.]